VNGCTGREPEGQDEPGVDAKPEQPLEASAGSHDGEGREEKERQE
jgi:hypothetical protein